MIIDLVHNYIVKNTITDSFVESVEKNLLPALSEKYGAGLSGIQMYEDYIADAFYQRGDWYYPLTVMTLDGPVTQWVKWKMKAGNFKDGVPYAYVGAGLLDITIADDVPEEFSAKLVGRSRYYEGGAISVNVDTTVNDPTLLVGKYSQTFVDEMARQLTVKIEEAMSVNGIASSTLSLTLLFAPATYMEHTSENVTYRRLLISDKASAPRDFWVKWFREDGATAYTVSDNVSCENITFDIGEDASQKIREKEYRFLVSAGGDKYHNAMGRKNITEWRELVKRAVKRGELEKIELAPEVAENDDINKRLLELLGKAPEVASEPAPVKEENDEFARAMQYARDIVAERESAEEEAPEATEISFEPKNAVESLFNLVEEESAACVPVIEEVEDGAQEPETVEEEAPIPAPAMIIEDVDYASASDAEFEDIIDEEALEEEPESAPVPTVERIEAAAPVAENLEAKLRAEIEAKLRAEYEAEAKAKAEADEARLRKMEEDLRRKNAEMLAAAEAENQRLRKLEEARRAEEEKLRNQLEQQLLMEARERERMAEAARIALAEQKKAEAEAAARAKAKEDEEKRAAFERQRAEEVARVEAERKAEAERLRREADERAKESKAAAAISANIKSKNYTYTSKSVRLLFRRSVDPNITSRIYEIIKTTLEYYGKDKMYMRIKATIPDTTTVILEFVEIPMEEMALLSNIIKVLGNSGLGIAKAIVE
ncbi:MAG: hypothetical protein IJX92_02270 [Clostridia bacterium]|nr:hypothetical protein [Clostridia bacterium]